MIFYSEEEKVIFLLLNPVLIRRGLISYQLDVGKAGTTIIHVEELIPSRDFPGFTYIGEL